MSRAVVVGSGPNGLTAAVVLARAGLDVTVLEAAERIGGGTRSDELTVPGLLHDRCSAVHPLGIASPAFAELGLEAHGLRWSRPSVDLTHPLGDGEVAVLWGAPGDTGRGLGVDDRAWRRRFEPLVDSFDELTGDVLGPVVGVPDHPLKLARFGVAAMQPAVRLARRWQTDGAQALFAGVAAHAFQPLHHPFTAAIGLTLIAAGHRHGWPVAVGGSQAIADALATALTQLGGTIETNHQVRSLDELRPAEVILLDLVPRHALRLLGDEAPTPIRHAYRRYRHGPAAFKLDLAVEGGIPWADDLSPLAGTVHLGGTLEEVAQAELDVCRGRMPRRPFVLVAQQYLADPSRSLGSIHPVWTYAHVPHAYSGDATEAILGQLERFAPGTRERIVASSTVFATDWQRHNLNYVGGDIGAGANDWRQLLFRPRLGLNPYDSGVPGVYLCSAATPPGAGVHGMCGYHAANRALGRLGAGSP